MPITNNDFQADIVVCASVPGADAATATNYGKFFIADRAYYVKSVSEVHATAGNDAGSVTLNVEKLTGTTALDSGVNVMSSTFNLKGTANTIQTDTGSATIADRKLAAGDRLALKDGGTLTTLADVCVAVTLTPLIQQ